MCSDSPTRGFPYTNSRPLLAWSGPGLSALIHPAAPRACVFVSVCVWVGVWELTSAVMTAHWKETCGKPEPARSFQDACNQALRTVSLLCPSCSHTHWCGPADEAVARWKYMNVRTGWWGFKVNMFLLFSWMLIDLFAELPLCSLFMFSSSITESCWICFFFVVFKVSNTDCGKQSNPLNVLYIIWLRATLRRISLKFISCNTSFQVTCSQQVIKIPLKEQNCKCLCHRLEKQHSIKAF